MHFDKEINGWKSWGAVFQDKEAFTPLAMAILVEAGFPTLPLENLSPGTNAVFRSGHVVIKIYVPIESGLDTYPDWLNEQAVMNRAAELGVPAPKLLAAGEKQDKYLFRWIIMEYCPGTEAGDAFAGMNSAERAAFAKRVKEVLQKLNHPADIVGKDLKKQAAENVRFDCLHPQLTAELKARAAALELEDNVLVHGDCTGENLLVSDEGIPMLIDFADCTLAPAWYELPAAVFELFKCDRDAVNAFRGEESRETFLKKLIDGLCIHDFGGYILHDFFEREGIDLHETASIRSLELLLWNRLFDEGSLAEYFTGTAFPDKAGSLMEDAKALYLKNQKDNTLAHVTKVAETAEKLAKQFGADPEICRTAAMLHDLAAVLPRESMKQAAFNWGMELDPAEEKFPLILHQRFGAILTREWLGVTDPDILSAIRHHTTLRRDASDIDMIVFLADKISWDQQETPPFLPAVEAGLQKSLKAGCLAYLDYITRHNMILLAHKWLSEAHIWLRKERAKGEI